VVRDRKNGRTEKEFDQGSRHERAGLDGASFASFCPIFYGSAERVLVDYCCDAQWPLHEVLWMAKRSRLVQRSLEEKSAVSAIKTGVSCYKNNSAE
jgi:hypothetical protein